MMKTLTVDEVREAARAAVADIIDEYKDEPETSREAVLDRVWETNDSLFGSLVQHGMIGEYTVDDMVRTAQPCTVILDVCDKDAWIADDNGLWDGLKYGVLAAIAFHSLEYLLYEYLKEAGYDTNDDYPFERDEEDA